MGKHFVYATIYDKSGRILSRATNNYTRSHPIQAKFAARAGQPERIFLHAEILALARLRGSAIPAKIHVERFRKDGTPACAKPCPVCEAAINHWKIKYVTHT